MSDALVLVAAVARNNVIGKDNALPWRIPGELKHFRAVTVGHAVIMGRKTFDSIAKPLAERRNIVVSRQPGLTLDGAEVFAAADQAIDAARATDTLPFIIGGGALYEMLLPRATELHLTEIDAVVEGDTFFPELNRAEWTETYRRRGDAPELTFVGYARPSPL
jgi:dihydrofolate reductase